MEDLTINLCENDIRTYLTKMQEIRNKIDSLQKEVIDYNNQRFQTLTFDDLGKTARDFLADVKRQHS